MTKTTSIAILIAAAVAAPTAARAQAPVAETVFIGVNVGGQVPGHDITTSTSFPLFGETAQVATAQHVNSGPIFDISGGYRFMRQFGVAIDFTTFSRTSTGAVTAAIPNPLVFNSPTTINVQQTGLKHSEFGTNIMAVWFVPVMVNLDVALSAGPSFTHVTQDIATASVPAGGTTATVAVTRETKTAPGINIGVDGTYLFTSRYGVGAFMRYVTGKVDLPEVSDVKAGGFQIGGGFRLRF